MLNTHIQSVSGKARSRELATRRKNTLLSFNPVVEARAVVWKREISRHRSRNDVSRLHMAEDVGFEPTRVVKPARVPGV